MTVTRWASLRAWLARLVADVPPDLERCEFDCKDLECQVGDWRTCENRLAGRGPKAPPTPTRKPS